VAERARRFVDHGRADHGYEHVDVGHNFRMTELAAAIGLEQLRSLQEFVRTRRQNAAELTSTINTTQFTPPIESAHTQHAFHQYTMRCQNRDDFVDFLDDFGVQTGVYYRTPIHKQPAYEGWTNSLPEAERAAAEVVSLPVHPELSEQDLRTIKTALTYFDAYKMEALSDC
jgi:perosamine synthetase